MTTLPKTIQCLLQPDTKKPSLIRSRIELKKPNFGKNEHLLRVRCVAPCADELRWAADFPGTFAIDKVFVPCFDFAGTVVLAPDESPFQPGTEVFGAGRFENTGSAREYTVIKGSDMAQKPGSLSFEEATTVPISALTAYQALFVHGGLACGWQNPSEKARNSSKKIIITAAAGGVGVWAVQLARAAGIGSIVAVCGPSNIGFVQSLGATSVVDYQSQSLEDWSREAGEHKADLVLDMVGGTTLSACWRAIKPDGMVISVNEPTQKDRPKDKRESQGLWFIFEPNGLQLAEIAGLVERGLVKPVIDSVFDFDRYQDAFDRVEAGHCRGKVVIKFAA